MMEIVAAWEPGSKDEDSVHQKWASDLSSVLAPLARQGGYANFLTPDANEQIGSAFGDNARRLHDLKRKFDPDNVFSSATPLSA
jgi:FAD/FMN-containing dehydrogenase